MSKGRKREKEQGEEPYIRILEFCSRDEVSSHVVGVHPCRDSLYGGDVVELAL